TTGSLYPRPGRPLPTRAAVVATKELGIALASRRILEEILKTLILMFVCLFCIAASAIDGYQITKKIPLSGQGGWDYLAVDEGARRLYVSHGTQVEVLDVDSGALVGKIENTPGVHGFAIAPELGRGFVSNGQAATVTIFELK